MSTVQSTVRALSGGRAPDINISNAKRLSTLTSTDRLVTYKNTYCVRYFSAFYVSIFLPAMRINVFITGPTSARLPITWDGSIGALDVERMKPYINIGR